LLAEISSQLVGFSYLLCDERILISLERQSREKKLCILPSPTASWRLNSEGKKRNISSVCTQSLAKEQHQRNTRSFHLDEATSYHQNESALHICKVHTWNRRKKNVLKYIVLLYSEKIKYTFLDMLSKSQLLVFDETNYKFK
jgi:hypothetical protein